MRGKMPAEATEKSVMVSEKGLMEVRHFWFSRKRIAEINVPAWPTPIHQKKFTMAKPQPIGMLIPQMPTPLVKSQPMATVRRPVRLKEMAKPINQPREVGRVRTIALILSVTERKVWPGPSTGVSWRISGESDGGCPTLMLSPVPGLDCAPRQDTWCAAANSIRPGGCSCAA